MGEQWILDMKEEKFASSAIENQGWRKRCIYRVPHFLRDLNPNAYTPTMASFGPYHHENTDRLKPMEAHKRRLLHRFLRIAGKSAEDAAEAVRREAEELIECYEGLEDSWKKDHNNTNKFVEVMVEDGCFLLEILLVGLRKQEEDCDYLDPILGKHYVISRLVADMLLLENQLPFRVLEILVQVGGARIGTTDALSLVLEAHYLKELLPENFRELPEDIQKIKRQEAQKIIEEHQKKIQLGPPVLHCLDIYRRCMTSKGDFFYNEKVDLSTASELVDSGVHLGLSETNCFKDITFTAARNCCGLLKTRVLRLPRISVDDTTETLLLNLVAFEQTHIEIKKHHVLSYVLFMDGLVDTARDVALLREEGIVKGELGSDKEIANLFNRLAKEVAFRGTSGMPGMMDVNTELRKYRRRCWPKTYHAFSQAYLENFWKFLSLLGALFLLGITVLQTVYTLLSYYYS